MDGINFTCLTLVYFRKVKLIDIKISEINHYLFGSGKIWVQQK